MKVSSSVRRAYERQLERCQKLGSKVDSIFLQNKEPRWHYESRLKSEESFALKLETGRCNDPLLLEDFFGCTLVVQSRALLRRAEEFVGKHFLINARRPPSDDHTHKEPQRFDFDDIRLYATWRELDSLPPSGLSGVVFEVQIKTFFQHAWTIATHDLTYKGGEISWGRQRIAYQVKAALEHAEISIQEAVVLSDCDGLRKSSPSIRELTKIVKIVRALWNEEDLPSDLSRLADNILRICKASGVASEDLERLLMREAELGRGALTRNLSPFGVVVQSLLWTRTARMKKALTKKGSRFKISRVRLF